MFIASLTLMTKLSMSGKRRTLRTVSLHTSDPIWRRRPTEWSTRQCEWIGRLLQQSSRLWLLNSAGLNNFIQRITCNLRMISLIHIWQSHLTMNSRASLLPVRRSALDSNTLAPIQMRGRFAIPMKFFSRSIRFVLVALVIFRERNALSVSVF
ncbi:unannotated protein [freshwater metagenome]|uniref:Unannotated protein n=1 Tax=freshwater metagenome TaxID=449393 RepID=A0A6J6TZN4_9ZZZZ